MEMNTSLEPTGDDETRKLEAFRQHLRSCTRRSSCEDTLWHGFDISDNPEIYMEERRKHKQAKLARFLKKVNGKRLSTGYNPRSACDYEEEQCGAEDEEEEEEEDVSITGRRKRGPGRMGGVAKKKPEKLRMEKENNVIKLSDVKLINPNDVGCEETGIGSLETHVNGFLYRAYGSSFHLQCLFKDIKASFFQLADNSSPPLLHFCLNTSIKVGKRKTKDILFHLLMTTDSDPVDYEKQKHEEDRDGDLQDFVADVEDKWMSTEAFSDLVPIQEFEGEDIFHVDFQGRDATLELTFTFIVVRVVPPSGVVMLVVNQEDMEIVNFVRSGCGAIHMTVVCQDFRVDSMLQVTIPLRSFSEIKSWLYRGNVKYYVNEVENWESRLKEIAGDFQAFLERGGWDQFQLEDKDTIQDYYSMSESDYSSDEMWGESCSESDGEEEEE